MLLSRIGKWIREHWLLSAIVLAVLGSGYYYFFTTHSSSTPIATTPRTARVEKKDLRVTVSGSGQVEADSQVDLKPVVAGDALEVTSVAVKNDQPVTKGQVIAVLDNIDAQRSVQQARLNVWQSTIKQKQTNKLYKTDTASDRQERQLAEVSVQQSGISLANALDKLDNYTIRAPFDGIVTGLSVESGDTISQTGVLASVITKKLHVSISLNEVDAAKVAEGNSVLLTFDAFPDVRIKGTVQKLDTIGKISQNVVSYGAEIELSKQTVGLKPGMSASADITVAEQHDVLVVPNAALSEENGNTVVMVVNQNGSNRTNDGLSSGVSSSSTRTGEGQGGEKRIVITGLVGDTETGITSGLTEGETVLLPSVTSATSTSTQTNQQQGSIFNLFRSSGSGVNRSGLGR